MLRRYFRLSDIDEAERRRFRLAAEYGQMIDHPPSWLHKRRGRSPAWLVIEAPDVKAAFPLYHDDLSADGSRRGRP